MFPESLRQSIEANGFVAVLVLDEVETAVPLAQALLKGGVRVIELTLRTPVALEALRRIRAEAGDIIAGVGTILTTQQLHQARAAGAQFGVAPGTNPRVLAEAAQVGLPFAPGVCTPTDIDVALGHGCHWMKFFPAEPCGGISYLRSIAAPFQHLDIRFIPLGGITPDNLPDYLRDPLVAAAGGSWVAPAACVQASDWPAITARAQAVSLERERIRQAVRVGGGEWA